MSECKPGDLIYWGENKNKSIIDFVVKITENYVDVIDTGRDDTHIDHIFTHKYIPITILTDIFRSVVNEEV